MTVPDYFYAFRCIADKCRHSCCIGWEIDIDPGTYAFYGSVDGALGKKLKENIIHSGGVYSFRLGENDRCPFLMKNGLCEIICEKGEKALCDICAEHPRFYFESENFTCAGLGLCCEAAAELIINKSEKVRFIDSENENPPLNESEKAYFELFFTIIDIIQNRNISISERLEKAMARFGLSFGNYTPSRLAKAFRSLERLDSAWDGCIDLLEKSEKILPATADNFQTEFEQLAVYFLWRHLVGGLNDGRYKQRAAFSLVSTAVIACVFASCSDQSRERLCDTARMYSGEIEYSDENIDILLDTL